MSTPTEPPTAAPRRGPLGLFRALYGKGPLHLIGHLLVIAITAYVLSIIFQMKYAPRPWNLALWLLGGAVLHDGVFLPIYGVLNAAFTRAVGAGDDASVKELAMGPPAPAAAPHATAPVDAPPTRDQLRRVPVINHIRTPLMLSAVLFMVFLPRILNRQPQNFVNALGHAPPDFLMRWVWVTVFVCCASAALYAARWLRSAPRRELDARPHG
jgi:hypothetical protein